MAKTKKTLSLVLAIVMALSILAFNSFAASETAKLDITADKTSSVKANDNITFTVKITNNYFLGVASVPVKYDAALFDFVSYSVPDTIFTKAGTTLKEIKHTSGMATVSIFADTSAKGALAQKFTAATTLFTITLKAKVDIGADTTVSIKADQRTLANPKGELFLASISGADVTDDSLIVNDLGQVITTTGATISGGGSVQVPALKVKDGTTGVIDATRKYVYGITPGEAVANYFEATNGGTLEFVNNSSKVTNGTGATINLKKADGTVIETYTVIIYGDVDGNGTITANDTLKVKQKVNGVSDALPTDAALAAADVDRNDSVTGNDVLKFKQYVEGVKDSIPQV